METFLTILITFLFFAGSFILLKLNKLRKAIYNDINDINETGLKIPRGLSIKNIDDNLMELLVEQVRKEQSRIVVIENETDRLTEKDIGVELKKEETERRVFVSKTSNDSGMKIPTADDNENAPEVELIKSLGDIVERQKLLMIDQIEAYLINFLDTKKEMESVTTMTAPAKKTKKIKVNEPIIHQDETEELRRRAIERIAKLRNLSFNINATDPNNEFETVPAYLRRNMELNNPLADVESFYSNYTVRSDENNQAEISTINIFLDGKKPD